MGKTFENAIILGNLRESVDEAFRRFEAQGGRYDPAADSEIDFNERLAMLDAFEDMRIPLPGENLERRGV